LKNHGSNSEKDDLDKDGRVNHKQNASKPAKENSRIYGSANVFVKNPKGENDTGKL